MNETLVISIAGILVIGFIGLRGRKSRAPTLEEWALGGRRHGTMTMWFLQAGEIYTTFTFLGMAGLASTAGVASLYAVPYVPIGYAVLYFIAPLIWTRSQAHGYVTIADYMRGSYNSKSLESIVAIAGVIFLLPYLQLQITGLGLAMEFATNSIHSSYVAMVLAFASVVVFVQWSGIRGVAYTSYLKDALVVAVLVAAVAVIPRSVAGGITRMFHDIAAVRPEKMVLPNGRFGTVWFFSSVAASAIGVMFMVAPQNWPALLSSRSASVARRNYIFLPIYSIGIMLPIIIGFAAVLSPQPTSASNVALLELVRSILRNWFLGIVVVATASAAMVPAAGLVIGITSLITNNIFRCASEQQKITVNRWSVIAVTFLALLLAIGMPNLLANMLLMTFSGLDQLAPGIAISLLPRRFARASSVLAGIVVGLACVVVMTFVPGEADQINSGIVALPCNVTALLLAEAVQRIRVARAGSRG